jgi:hypothetical protein
MRADGLGLRRISALSGVGRTKLAELADGRSGPVRRETVDKLRAAADRATVAPGVIVDGWLTRQRIRELLDTGYTLEWIAADIGWTKSNLVAMLRRGPVTARTARKVTDLWYRHRTGAPLRRSNV